MSNARLRVALLPSEKLLPVQVAEQERLFEAHGVEVEVSILEGAHMRDQAVACGRFDAYLVNLVSLVLYRLGGADLRAVRTLLRPSATHPLFHLLARPGLPAGHALRRSARFGISRGTIVEFVTYYLLRALGTSMDDFSMQEVPDIASRCARLCSGQLDYATLPEPMASEALAQGAGAILTDSAIPVLPPPVLALRAPVLQTEGEQVRRFLAAIDEAASRINKDPERYRALLARGGHAQAAYHLPRFPVGQVPTPGDLAPIVDWLRVTRPGSHARLAGQGRVFDHLCATGYDGAEPRVGTRPAGGRP